MDLGQPIARGNTAEIYLWEGKAVKLFHDTPLDREAEYEAGKQRAAYACGLLVPQVYDVTRIAGRPAIVMEYIQGMTLGQRIEQDPEQMEAYIALSATIQAEMHERNVDALESMGDKLARQLRAAKHLSEPDRDALLERLSGIPVENRLCHGDYHVYNLIPTEAGTAIIDWVDASAGSPCADAYRTYLLYTQFSDEWAEMYLRLYCDKSGRLREDVLAWAPIVAGARLSENVPEKNAELLLEIVRKHLG